MDLHRFRPLQFIKLGFFFQAGQIRRVPNAGWLLHEGRGVECGEVSSRLKNILEISKGREGSRIALYFDRPWAVLANISRALTVF